MNNIVNLHKRDSRGNYTGCNQVYFIGTTTPVDELQRDNTSGEDLVSCHFLNTVKPVLSGHSKEDQKTGFQDR